MERDRLIIESFFQSYNTVAETVSCSLMESISVAEPRYLSLIDITRLYKMSTSSNDVMQKRVYKMAHAIISSKVQTDSIKIEMHPIEDDTQEIRYKINSELISQISKEVTVDSDPHTQFTYLSCWMLLFDHFAGAVNYF